MTAIKYKEGGTWKTLTMPSAVHIGVSAPDQNAKQLWVDTDEVSPIGYYIPPLVSALPAAPFDGQEVRYQNAAMATDGIVWTFRYRAAASAPYKWELVGGGELFSQDLLYRSISFNASSWGNWAPGSQITVPSAGVYQLVVNATLSNLTSACQWGAGVRINTTDPAIVSTVGVEARYAMEYLSTATGWVNITYMPILTFAAGDTLQPRYWHNGTNPSTCIRVHERIGIRPMRVS